MNYPRLTYGLFAGVLFLPSSLSLAASAHDAVTACAQALTEELAQKQGGVPVKFHLDKAGDQSSRRVTTTLSIYVYATDPRSDDIVARANCVVDTGGRVKRLTSLPLDPHKTAAL